MKKILPFLLATVLLLTGCTTQLDKYNEWITEIPSKRTADNFTYKAKGTIVYDIDIDATASDNPNIFTVYLVKQFPKKTDFIYDAVRQGTEKYYTLELIREDDEGSGEYGIRLLNGDSSNECLAEGYVVKDEWTDNNTFKNNLKVSGMLDYFDNVRDLCQQLNVKMPTTIKKTDTDVVLNITEDKYTVTYTVKGYANDSLIRQIMSLTSPTDMNKRSNYDNLYNKIFQNADVTYSYVYSIKDYTLLTFDMTIKGFDYTIDFDDEIKSIEKNNSQIAKDKEALDEYGLMGTVTTWIGDVDDQGRMEREEDRYRFYNALNGVIIHYNGLNIHIDYSR